MAHTVIVGWVVRLLHRETLLAICLADVGSAGS